MTPQEQKVLDTTVELWEQYLKLPVIHPMDNQEFCHKIHDIQRFILSRTEELKLVNNGT